MNSSYTPPTGAILHLVASQIDVALRMAAVDVAALSDAVAMIASLTAALPMATQTTGAAISHHTGAAIRAMQYHDQLVQRLEHVRDTLRDLEHATAAPRSADDWQQMLATVRGRFSMNDERVLFDQLLEWQSTDTSKCAPDSVSNGRNSVELF